MFLDLISMRSLHVLLLCNNYKELHPLKSSIKNITKKKSRRTSCKITQNHCYEIQKFSYINSYIITAVKTYEKCTVYG